MLYKIISSLVLFFSVLTLASSAESQDIGSLAVTPLDYDQYADTIDLKLLRFFSGGEVFFYDSKVTTYDNQTKTVRNATILSTGQFLINDGDDEYYLTVDDTSGVVSVTNDSATNNGLFYIDNNYLYYQYHKVFVACRTAQGSHRYRLSWRGASSPAVCENPWLLIYMKPYGSSNGNAVSSYYPNEYVASIGSTATDNTDTSTNTDVASSSSSAGANGQLIHEYSGAGLMYSGLSVLIIAVLSLVN